MKRKLTSLAICIAAVVSLVFTGVTVRADEYFSGSGTEDDPFLISTATDLTQLAALTNTAGTNTVYTATGLYYKLTDDIDMSSVASFIPISCATNSLSAQYKGGPGSSFKATIDGDGHVIRNIKMSAETLNTYGSSFGIVGFLHSDAVIKNLGVENMTVDGGAVDRACIGGIAGVISAAEATPCLIQNCYVKGMTVTSTAAGGPFPYVGGIAGRTVGQKGTIQNCYATGLTYNLATASYSGGLLGSCGNANYTAENCYTTYDKIQGNASATAAYMVTKNCYMGEETANLKPEALGEAFVEDDTLLNDGLPVLAWEYDILHPETVGYTVTVNNIPVSDGQGHVPANAALVLKFDREMNPDTFNNITLHKNGEKVENLVFELKGKVLTIKPVLEFGTDYILFVSRYVQSVKDGGISAKAEEKEITFMTDTPLTVTDVKLNGKALSEAVLGSGGDVTVEAIVKTSDSADKTNVALIAALSDGNGVLKYAALDTASIGKASEEALSVSFSIPDDIGEDFILNIMVWDSVTDMNAYCKVYTH